MKEFYDYEQQIEKLEKDGLIIDDEDAAKDYLRLEGYYNVINGYAHIFKDKNNKKFITNVKFDTIKNLYEFDKALRSVVYKYTSLIECHIKALIAHEFSRVHGVDENEYLKDSSFSVNSKSREKIEKLIEDCKKTIAEALDSRSNKYREYISHNKKAHGHVPMWVLVRALTFGAVSIFYKNMKDEEKSAIAQNFGVSSEKLANILEVVVSFRNIVAHGERTFCARLPRTRLSTNLSIARKLNIPKNSKGENKFGRNDFLSLLICCKYMLSPLDFASFISELKIVLEILEREQTPSMLGKIKIQMGLSGKSWELLPRLIIND
ncbi:MAG: Abi family protein [Clostridiales bacterium]|nr:Abi family protein [Clostridiales bacterium]